MNSGWIHLVVPDVDFPDSRVLPDDLVERREAEPRPEPEPVEMGGLDQMVVATACGCRPSSAASRKRDGRSQKRL